jgi:16S rRNA (uracil1498-N3)-methyltransferase
MTLRLFVEQPLAAAQVIELPPAAVRHLQVRRLQPGAALVVFDGRGGEWRAEVVGIGRRSAQVRLTAYEALQREPARAVTLAVGMPANERMDWLVEKAAELGAARIVPLLCERSVLRLAGERAARRREHWQAVAVAAAEQSGATRLTEVEPVVALGDWLGVGLQREAPQARRCLLSLAGDAATAPDAQGDDALVVLSGPEGGLSDAEETAARAAGFTPLTLGPRTLRAETAPLVALARWQARARRLDGSG